METHQSICEWRGDSLDIYISTQFIWGVRDEIAAKLGIPPDKVRVVCEFMGGGFGSKNGAGDHTYIAAELAKRTGRPVRCMLTRREENLAAGNRNSTIQRLTAAARSDGTLVALAGEFVNATGWDGWAAPTDGPMKMLYDCENVRTVLSPAKINTPPMKAFRAPGFVEGTFGLECILDELAAKLDKDPLEIRKLNYAHSDDDRPYSSKNLMECYKRAEPHWQRREEVQARSEGPWRHGVGLASQIWYGGGGPPSYAWVRLGSDGRATVVTAMQDIGTGTATAMTQIAAEELGLPLDRVDLVLGDSARGPYASISAGSSTIPSMGPAVRSAAADAARQIIEIAAQRYDKEERVLSLQGGNVVSSDGGSWPIEEVVGLLEDAQILGKGARGPNPTGMQVLTFGVQVAEVAVDVETGEIRVERVAAIHDVGRVINPLGASSQVEGGIIQGIGHTLSEDRLLDPATGITLNQTLDAYKLPTIADVPEIVTELLDIPDEHLTNLGSKGLGEPPIVPEAAAIANAIRDATGADVRSLADLPRGDAESACARPRRRRRRNVELLQPSDLKELRRRPLHPRRHRGRPAAARRNPLDRHARRRARDRPARDRRDANRRRNDAGRARGRPTDPGGAPRGVPPGGEPAAAQHGLDRRQPPPGDSLLVLAAEVPMPAARRRYAATHARASTVSTRSSATTSVLPHILRTWPLPSSPCGRRCGRTGASFRWKSSSACPPTRTET